jgi:hypothetical protein
MLFRGKKIDFLVWRSLCSFPLMSSPANLPFKCALEGLLHCEQLMTASSPSSTNTMTAKSANSRIARSLARGVQDLRETVVVVVGRCRDSALECARRLAALGGAKVRQDTPRYAKDSLTVYQLHILWMDGWMWWNRKNMDPILSYEWNFDGIDETHGWNDLMKLMDERMKPFDETHGWKDETIWWNPWMKGWNHLMKPMV